MPDMYVNKEINDRKWYQDYARLNDIPTDQARAHKFLFNEGVGHFKILIDDVIQSGGGGITIPMQPEYIEKYLSGFTFEYRAFEGLGVASGTEGYWTKNPFNPTHIVIYYKSCGYRQRERYTQIHELLHFAQTLDPMFLNTFDELILNTTLPPETIVKLLERITERATAMYLMPNEFFRKKYREIRSVSSIFGDAEVRELARAFDVSVQSATYRLNECLSPYNSAENGLMIP